MAAIRVDARVAQADFSSFPRSACAHQCRLRMIRVVLDTSILVAAARSKHGASHAILSALPHTGVQPVISVPVFLEYRAVLLRRENLLQRTPQQVDGFLDYLLAISHIQEIFYLWRPALADAEDEMILELAVAAGCRYIVTHNIRDFREAERWGVSAVTPATFLGLLPKFT
jgi:putative PIN family toxin of toxin-antitoxin system